MILCLAFTACALAPAATGASAARPPVSLVASPARVTLAGRARATIRVANTGTAPVVVDVTRAGYALDLRGRPRVVPGRARPRSAVRWLRVRPARLVIRPRTAAVLAVSSVPPAHAEPGDHQALLLATTRRRRSAALSVRMRLGIVVVVRVPGRVVRRLVPVRLRVRRAGRTRLIEVTIANRGNISEVLDARCVRVTLRRRGRLLTTLRARERNLLPKTSGIAEIRYRGPIRGRLVALVEPAIRRTCARGPRRAFAVRL